MFTRRENVHTAKKNLKVKLRTAMLQMSFEKNWHVLILTHKHFDGSSRVWTPDLRGLKRVCYHWTTRSTRKSCWIMLTWWENGCCKCHLKNFDMSWSRHKHTLWCLLPGSNPRSLGTKASMLPLSRALDSKMLLNYVDMVRKCVLQMSFEKFGHVLTLAQTRTLACLLPGLNPRS